MSEIRDRSAKERWPMIHEIWSRMTFSVVFGGVAFILYIGLSLMFTRDFPWPLSSGGPGTLDQAIARYNQSLVAWKNFQDFAPILGLTVVGAGLYLGISSGIRRLRKHLKRDEEVQE